MKKVYILLLLGVLPYLGFSQTLKDYTFNTDGNKEGWTASGLSLSGTNPTTGSLIGTGQGSTVGFPSIRSEVYSPILAVASNKKIFVKIVAENATTGTIWQIGNFDTGSTNFGNGTSVDFTMPIVAPNSGMSTFLVELPINPDNASNGISQITIRAKYGVGTGISGTIKFDEIAIILKEFVTENSFVTNPNFESGLSPWSVSGTPGSESDASITSSYDDSNAGQLTYNVTPTTSGNQLLDNQVYDFSKTVNPSKIDVNFDVKSNNANLDIQVLYTLYDAFDAVISSNNTGSIKVTAADVWQNVSLSKVITDSFDKIRFSYKVKSTNANNNDYIAFDNTAATFTYIKEPTLGVNSFGNNTNTVSIFPNPVQNTLTISSEQNITKVEIYNMLGQNIASPKEGNEINVSDLNTGIYIARITFDNGAVANERFIKK